MRENEPLSQTRTGAFTPEVSLTVSRQRICTRRAGNGSLGSEILGERGGIKGSLPRQDLLLLLTPWHLLSTAPGGAVIGCSRPGARKGGGAHRKRNIPKSGPPCSFLPIPSSCKGKYRLWEQVAERGSNERAKNDDPQLIVAVKLSEGFFCFCFFLFLWWEGGRPHG